MKIARTEPTPNPRAVKFILDGRILASGSRHYDRAPEPGAEPLAEALFAVKAVRSVYLSGDFLTVESADPTAWDSIRLAVEAAAAGLRPAEAVSGGAAAAGDERLARIHRILDERVRPHLAGDGGGLQVLGLEGDDLMIRYEGACGGCPHAMMGTLHAIQNLLRSEISPDLNVIPG